METNYVFFFFLYLYGFHCSFSVNIWDWKKVIYECVHVCGFQLYWEYDILANWWRIYSDKHVYRVWSVAHASASFFVTVVITEWTLFVNGVCAHSFCCAVTVMIINRVSANCYVNFIDFPISIADSSERKWSVLLNLVCSYLHFGQILLEQHVALILYFAEILPENWHFNHFCHELFMYKSIVLSRWLHFKTRNPSKHTQYFPE